LKSLIQPDWGYFEWTERLFRIISIPSKFCYFRSPDHVISMD
jgi:hypothetical protein